MIKMSPQLLILVVTGVAAQTLDVKIIGREDRASTYEFVVPGYSQTDTTGKVDCASFPGGAGCKGSATSITTGSPSIMRSYQVRGATLALQLPDRRVAVVNCDSKPNLTEWSNTNGRRSCRIPPLDGISVEFSGDKATLRWVVSIDGKKFQRETYKVLAVIPARSPTPSNASEVKVK